MTNTLLSVTVNPGWTFAKLLGSGAFLVIILYQSELLANAIIQALVIAFPSTLYSSAFNSISKKIVKLGLPSATLLSYGLLEVYSGTNFFVTNFLLGQGTLPLLEDMWTIILFSLSIASVLAASSVRIYLYLLRKRLNLPSENNIFSNLSIAIICMMNIAQLGALLQVRVSSEPPGGAKIHANIFQAIVPVCIVYGSDGIWNYACELPWIRPLARYFKRRQLSRIAERDSGSQKMKTHNYTISV